MSPELTDALRAIMDEVAPRYGADHTPDQARSHLLDRWPRLVAFGVTGRDDLRKLTVRRMDTQHGGLRGSQLTVDVRGTPLEGK